MLSKLARLVFNDSFNGACFCVFITFLMALYLQKWSSWIPVTLAISIFVTVLIGGILFGFGHLEDNYNKKQAGEKRQFLFGSYKTNLVFFSLGPLLCLPVIYFFDLNFYNLVLTAIAYALTFNVLYYNFWEKYNSA